jgi:hypothetical protein
MDPVTLIVAALATGAAAGLKETATSAVKEAYGTLKALLSRRYARVRLDDLERKPESAAKRESVAEDLADAGAGADDELLELARELVATIRRDDAEAGRAVGVDLADVEAQFIRVGKIKSTGTGFRGERLRLEGGLQIDEVDSGGSSAPRSP